MRLRHLTKIVPLTLALSLVCSSMVYAADFNEGSNSEQATVSQNEFVKAQSTLDDQTTGGVVTRKPAGVSFEAPRMVSVESVPTEEAVYAALIAMKSQYPEGMPWTNADGYIFYALPGITYYGYGCAGFAFILSDAAFGDLPARIHTDFDNVHVGDILRINNNSHSVVALEVKSDSFVIAEGNYNSSIHWGRTISRESVKKTGTEVMTRYPEGTSFPSVQEKSEVKAFCERLYNTCLGRASDDAGIADWSSRLLGKEITGAQAGAGFVFSKEYIDKNTSNVDYVEMLYQVFLNRGADAAGKAGWVDLLNQGVSREFVYRGFAESVEYDGICSSYGIIRGTYPLSQARDQNPELTKFVNRLYVKALNRTGEADGINYWCNEILHNGKSAEMAAEGYIFSTEFTNKRLSDTDYVKVLYRTFMDREYDAGGLTYWVNKLGAGESRQNVMRGFSRSEEFQKICNNYGVRAY